MVIVIVSIRYVLAQIGQPSKAVLRILISLKQCCISYDLANFKHCVTSDHSKHGAAL